MSYDTYHLIFIAGLVLSIVMLIASVLIFFLLHIKDAIGDLTGSNKRKGIENIHKNVSITKKASKHQPKPTTPSGELRAESAETAKISLHDRYDNLEAAETSVLNSGDAQTTVLSADAQQTTVLNTGFSAETTVLNAETETTARMLNRDNVGEVYPGFSVAVEITYVHSAEVIR